MGWIQSPKCRYRSHLKRPKIRTLECDIRLGKDARCLHGTPLPASGLNQRCKRVSTFPDRSLALRHSGQDPTFLDSWLTWCHMDGDLHPPHVPFSKFFSEYPK